jgi:hypothetical protein
MIGRAYTGAGLRSVQSKKRLQRWRRAGAVSLVRTINIRGMDAKMLAPLRPRLPVDRDAQSNSSGVEIAVRRGGIFPELLPGHTTGAGLPGPALFVWSLSGGQSFVGSPTNIAMALSRMWESTHSRRLRHAPGKPQTESSEFTSANIRVCGQVPEHLKKLHRPFSTKLARSGSARRQLDNASGYAPTDRGSRCELLIGQGNLHPS